MLDEVSMQIGQKNYLVQGPGGNTSWKQGSDMWIKASGYQLRDAIAKEIFCQVNIDNPLVNVNSDGKKPSIESALHSIRPEQFVVHVHTINTVSLGCRRELDENAIKFLKKFEIKFLEYHRPGEKLANVILHKNYNPEVQGLLLANHGLVLWGEDIFDLWQLLIEIERELDELYPTNMHLLEKIKSETLVKYLNERHLTPDHAVFDNAMSQTSFPETLLWLLELRNALEISVSKISRVDDVQFISNEESVFLKQWDAEKLRLKMNL
jgi:rhamnose utilization protein RhaD (predicted bifunctional aldolase and dehydrogenase)